MTLAVTIIFALNVLWFAMGFRFFSLTPKVAAKVLIPRSARESPLFTTMAAAVRFLGGMNLALSLFAALILIFRELYPDPKQLALFAVVFAVAHGSQFAYNVPVLLGGGRQGEALWPVRSGPMLFIFVVDCALMLANGALAAVLWLS